MFLTREMSKSKPIFDIFLPSKCSSERNLNAPGVLLWGSVRNKIEGRFLQACLQRRLHSILYRTKSHTEMKRLCCGIEVRTEPYPFWYTPHHREEATQVADSRWQNLHNQNTSITIFSTTKQILCISSFPVLFSLTLLPFSAIINKLYLHLFYSKSKLYF